MQHFRDHSQLKLNEGLELKHFYPTHALIKAKQYFIIFPQKIELRRKGGCVKVLAFIAR